ncbi:MAG: transcription initiation factor IIB [Candidatus Aenigmarchaeota archaeon]|nr:transcription initiation factor IIB [Candidatus Aenigmarchaeota archaeon]
MSKSKKTKKSRKFVRIQKCPECGSKRFTKDKSRGEIVCSKCGFVIKEKIIDTSPEWRAFDSEQRQRKTRGGAPLTPTKHDKGLTTEIGRGKGELFKVIPLKRPQYYRLRKWQKRLVESKARNLSFALSELQRLVSFLGLPRPVHEEVAIKYEKAVDRGLVRGRSMESVIAALLYAVCREMKTPRTLEEIAEATGIEKREIGRNYRYIARQLGMRILPAMPKDYVPRFASMLGLSDKVQARAIRILKQAKKFKTIHGKGPTGVAAAALYIAAVLGGEKRTQREIADAVGVTEVTIRNRFKEMVRKFDIEEKIEKKLIEG